MNETLLEEAHSTAIAPKFTVNQISHYVKDILARVDVFPAAEAQYLQHQINSKNIVTTLMYGDDNGSHEIVINQFEASLAGGCLYTRGRISIYAQGQIRNVQLSLNKPPVHLEITLEDINICPVH
ncbi:hypothetical protein MNBD_GAMMA09-2244 [hydrothermal vent metagenome]|uniref:Uncharacterized protein n=1 Tax=hydrothermal vent metagenome TaxID=652676 RepID=A0A3B0XZ24_9ZZZZ